jgi:hypothetical protein
MINFRSREMVTVAQRRKEWRSGETVIRKDSGWWTAPVENKIILFEV